VEFLATYVVVNTSILKVKEITSNACTWIYTFYSSIQNNVRAYLSI
jgi:hypothetical protein